MWLTMTMALAMTPTELAEAGREADEQLKVCATEGCDLEEGAKAAFTLAVYRYQDTGVADGELAAAVRVLDPELFADLPDVVQASSTKAPSWAAPVLPVPPPLPRGLPEWTSMDCSVPYTPSRPVRVMVTQWKDTDTTAADPKLRRNVKALLEGARLSFFPALDLYQGGRADRLDDPARVGGVPDELRARVAQAADDLAAVPDEALPAEDWAVRARQGAALADAVWFVDRDDLREALFLLDVQVARAAALGGVSEEAPFRSTFMNEDIDTYMYDAALLAHWDPELPSLVGDASAASSLAAWSDRVASAPRQQMSLMVGDELFDAAAFADEYTVLVDGVEVRVDDPDGMLELPPGRADVTLRRSNGHGLSDRILFNQRERLMYFAREHARSTTSRDLIAHLMEDPYECSPQPLPAALRGHLATYQQVHPDEDVVVVVPERGRTGKGALLLWRWDAEQAQLVRVGR